MKNSVIFLLLMIITVLIISRIMDADRGWNDGILQAERHHLLTGQYYNTYSKNIRITAAKDTLVDYVLEKEASFEKTYWKKLSPKKLNHND